MEHLIEQVNYYEEMDGCIPVGCWGHCDGGCQGSCKGSCTRTSG